MKRSAALIVLLTMAFALGCRTKATNGPANVSLLSKTSPSTAQPSSSNGATVTIDSPDGVKLVGSYFESPKPNSPALLLLHQWQSDRHSYDDLAKKLQSRGINVLSIDGRGFGESTKKADGTTVSAGRTDADLKAMLGDVNADVDFLLKEKNIKSIGIVGASYGSSLALIYAADHPNIAAVALLSPGLNYFGNMPTEPAIKKYGDRPLIMFAADDDKESADAVRQLDPTGQDNPKHLQHIYSSGGHGTALLKVGAADELSDFFAKVFHL